MTHVPTAMLARYWDEADCALATAAVDPGN
jgi:hypothetical protein